MLSPQEQSAEVTMSGPGSDYSYKPMNCKNRTLGEVDDEVIAGTIKKYKLLKNTKFHTK